MELCRVGLIKKQSMYSCREQRRRQQEEERGEASDPGGITEGTHRESGGNQRGLGTKGERGS